ncbi:MAG TPA: hypothetical protein VF310_01100, partial [Vicinamibacteria bacterium]
MQDLERAAAEALEELAELEPRLEQATQRMAALRAQVDEAAGRLEDDWQALAAQCEEFLHHAESIESVLEQSGAEARQALGAAEHTLSEAEATLPAAIEEARGALEA